MVAPAKKIEGLVSMYEGASLECDGMTRVLSHVLKKEGISHKTLVGKVTITDLRGKKNIMNPHFWIDLGNGTVLDYRLRMWFGNKSYVPHGVFDLNKNKHVKYDGEQMDMTITDGLFMALAGQATQTQNKED